MDQQSVGLSLSGGGYRAMLYHAGAIQSLNELGRLPLISRISAVSGGAIAAVSLGIRWHQLQFDQRGVAANLATVVLDPLISLAQRTVDWQTGLQRTFLPQVMSSFGRALDDEVTHGLTLQDLPEDASGPRIILCATNLETGSLFRMSRPYMRDWRGYSEEAPALRLSTAIEASAAFPPFLAPVRLICGGHHLQLIDGGVYDNLALESIYKRCQRLYVSDGGAPFVRMTSRSRHWISTSMRTATLIDEQVRRLRRKELGAALVNGRRVGAYWRIDRPLDSYPATAHLNDHHYNAMPLTLSRLPTRLKALPVETIYELIEWGRASALASIKSYDDF